MKLSGARAVTGILLMTGLVTVISVMTGISRLRQKAVESQIENIEILSHTFEQHLTQTAETVSVVVSANQSFFAPENIRTYGKTLLANAPYLRSLYTADPDGRILSGTEKTSPLTRIIIQDFLPVPFGERSVLQFGPPMSGRDIEEALPLTGKEKTRPHTFFFPAIKKLQSGGSEARNLYALIVFNPDYFDNFYAQRVPENGTYVTILRFDGLILFTNDPQLRTGGHLSDFTDIQYDSERLHVSGNYKDIYIYSFRSSAVYPLSLLVKRDLKSAMKKWENERMNVLGIIVFLTGVALVLSLILLLRIAAHQETERKLLEREHEQALLSEERRRRSMLQLLINLAHQWRQPLNTVGLLVQKIQIENEERELSRESLEAASNAILQEISELSRTITKFTEIYENKGSQKYSSPAEVLQLAASLVTQEGSLHPLKITSEFKENEVIPVAHSHLLDIFFQLLDNAHWISEEKKTENPEITFRCEHKDRQYILTAEDNLGGIDPEIIFTIFSPYTTSRFRKRNRGMGLFQVHQIVTEIYGGTIEAENTEKGARFIITFPDRI